MLANIGNETLENTFQILAILSMLYLISDHKKNTCGSATWVSESINSQYKKDKLMLIQHRLYQCKSSVNS